MKILKNKKNILLIVLVIGVISITVAFAALTTRLKISGTANTSSASWNIHFQNWTNQTQSTVDGHQNTAEYDDTQILQTLQPNVTKIEGVNVILKQPGDYVKYRVQIKNDGTIDGELSNFTRNISVDSNVIDYTITCTDASENNALTVGYVLAHGEYVTCELEIKYKNQTNSHTSGTDQIYQQGSITANIGADWTWVQKTNSQEQGGGSEPSPSPVVKCQNGTLIDNTGWCLTNPGATLENQRFEYWDGDEKIMSGWHEIEDLYGITQEYYFEDGIAHVGWLTWNNNRYFLSKYDDDGNNYVNCNLIKDTVMEIDNECYEFSPLGVATASNACSPQVTYNLYTTFDEEHKPWGENITSSTYPSNWYTYIKENTSSVQTREVCLDTSTVSICYNPYLTDCNFNSGTGTCTNQSGYTQQKINEAISKGAVACSYPVQSAPCQYDDSPDAFVCCFSDNSTLSIVPDNNLSHLPEQASVSGGSLRGPDSRYWVWCSVYTEDDDMGCNSL